jgi:glycosyltransferase involved in cell wall biosynthesis
MKKVLIIANLYHASPRIPAITKYLPDFGWEPTILTVPIKEDPRHRLYFPSGFEEKVRIIEAPYKGDVFQFWRKLFRFFGFNTNKSILNQIKEDVGIKSQKSFIDFLFNLYMTFFAYPDEEKGWIKPALKSATDLFEKEKFDIIISSSSPVTTHIIAHNLKRKYKIPWLADLRDLWTQNHNYNYPWLRKRIEQKLEIKILSIADGIITVSQPLVNKLAKLHVGKKIYTLTNGFDPEKINEPVAKLTEKFTFTYTGQIYSGKQDPLKILVALKELILDRTIDPNDIEVRFYGLENYWLQKEIEKSKLSFVVKQFGLIPREDSLEKQRESQLLLLLNWEDKQEKGIYTGKIFEYLAARRPILATGGFESGIIEKLLKETRAGVNCSRIEDIKNYFKKFYSEYKKRGRLAYTGSIEKINKYSYKTIAGELANLLNDLLKYELEI